MDTAKIIKSGNTQSVILPKEYQFDVSEVEIFRRADEIVLRKPPKDSTIIFRLLADMSDDFMENGRQQPNAKDK